MNQQQIQWHQAVQILGITEQQIEQQQEAIEEFLESNCDYFSFSDW